MIYKYLAMGCVGLALIIGAWFYGVHTGKLAGTAKYDALVASVNAATAKATADAKTAQQQADSATQAQLEAALQTAQQAVVDMQTIENQRNATIQLLTKQVQANEQNPSVAQWSRVVIPPASLSGLCWLTPGSGPSAGCNGH